MPFDITSTQNPRVKQLIQLRKRSVREREQRYLIDGHRDIQRAAASGVELEAVYYCPEQIEASRIAELGQGISVSPHVLEKISYRENSEGLLAVARMRALTLDQLTVSENPLILIAVSIEKPGNLGAILRTADAVGADAVLVATPAVDIYNPNVIRSSTGTVFTVPLAVADGPAIQAWLAERGISGIATVPDATQSLFATDLRGPVAFLLGREQDGLDDAWQTAASIQVSIPMKGQADSLNVSVSAAVLAYEAIRQREAG
ncbi:MAG: TrmH family RNA methyltransferase [Kiritimatiellia bacterium]|jgi:TrmH family RNA methyltransferase